MDFATIIDMLGRELNIPDLRNEGSDEAGIVFDDHLDVRFFVTPDGHSIGISGDLGEHTLTEKRAEQLLAANIDGIGTGGAFISQDDDENIWMTLILPMAELDFPGFLHLLEEFVNYFGMWYEQLEQDDGGDVEPSKNDDSASSGFGNDMSFVRG